MLISTNSEGGSDMMCDAR